MATKKRTKAIKPRRPRKPAPPARTRFCIKLMPHGFTHHKFLSHHGEPKDTTYEVLAAIHDCMVEGAPLNLRDAQGDTVVLCGFAIDCAVEVTTWAEFAEGQAKEAAAQRKAQLG